MLTMTSSLSSPASAASAAMGGFDMCVRVCGFGLCGNFRGRWITMRSFTHYFQGPRSAGSSGSCFFRVLRVQESSPPARQDKHFSDRC